MKRARLINPVWVSIEASDRAGSSYDRGTKEPRRVVARTDVRILAQFEPRDSRFQPEQIGAVEATGGHLLVLHKDCAARSWIPKLGDRVTRIGTRTTSLYVVGISDAIHYGRCGGSQGAVLGLGDRRPSAATPAH